MKLFLFDIDGTLLLTGGAGKIAFEKVFQELYQEDYIWDNITPDGRTDPSIIDELFEKRFQRKPSLEESEKVISLYEKEMKSALIEAPRFRVLPHANSILNHLSQRDDCHLGLATGNFERVAWLKLQRAKLDHHFHFGGFGSDHYFRNEMTKIAKQRGLDHLGFHPDEIYVIGDSIHDVSCGKEVGATTIAVLTGHTPKQDLIDSQPDYLIEDLSGLMNIV